MDLLARIEVDGVCLGGIRLSGVLRPKQVASVGAQTKTRAWAFRLGSSCASGVSHARCKWLPATCSPYHTSIRARLATPVRSLLPVTSNILPTKLHERNPKAHCSTAKFVQPRRGVFVSGFRPAFVSCGRRTPQGAAVLTRQARHRLKPRRGDTAACCRKATRRSQGSWSRVAQSTNPLPLLRHDGCATCQKDDTIQNS